MVIPCCHMSEFSRETEPGREASEQVVEGLLTWDRLKRLQDIVEDPEVRKGMVALLRTGINLGISGADTLPLGVGEMASWTADACKYIAQKFNINVLDTSPDVSLSVAVGTEALEFASGGLVPSHVVETTMQLKADWPRLKGAYDKARRIWKGRERELANPEVQEALEHFANT